MLRVKILTVGRSKEPWIDAGIAEYVRRMSSTLQLTTEWAKDDAHLLQLIAKEGRVVCLDPAGTLLTSEDLAGFLSQQLEAGGSRLTIVIGGAEGLPQSLRSGQYPMISFSRLTFTHQMCRLILAEQLYRSVEIWRGSPYHK